MLISIVHQFVKIVLNHSYTFWNSTKFCGSGVKIWQCDWSSFRNRIVNSHVKVCRYPNTCTENQRIAFCTYRSARFCMCICVHCYHNKHAAQVLAWSSYRRRASWVCRRLACSRSSWSITITRTAWSWAARIGRKRPRNWREVSTPLWRRRVVY